MATRYKVLGQVAPSATTNTTLYTVPSLKETIVSTLVVTNRGIALTEFDIAVRPGGETLADKHYIAKTVPINGADSTTITIGLTLTAGDVITVYAANANLSFSAFGSEIDL